MTFKPGIPLGNISPKDQVTDLQTNFSQFATKWAINHTALNDTHAGDHDNVILTRQTSIPAAGTDTDVLFCQDATSALGTQPQLFVRIPKFLPTDLDQKTSGNRPMQLTYNQVNTAGPIYQSFLPGGYLLYFGVSTFAVPTNSQQITLTPTPSEILIAIANSNNTSSGIARRVSTTIDSANKFTIYTPAHTTIINFTWMAIAFQ